MSLDLSLNYPDINFAMSNGGQHGIYEFDRFRLDAVKLMLYADGTEVSMPPKMVKTLTVLVESGGAILSKEELIERVWSDAIVDESNLSQHLYHLRKILGTQTDGRPYIETLRRRGYRFNGDIRFSDIPKNDQAPVAEIQPTKRTAEVERDGNVLRLVDWSPAVTHKDSSITHAESGPERAARPSSWIGVSMIAALLLLTVAVAAALKLWSSVNMPAVSSSEISLMRLTNGTSPEGAALSPNGDYFAYHEVVDGGEHLWLHQVGQASRVKIGQAPKGSSYGPKTFSPDGKFLFISLVDAGKTTLYRIPAIGGPPARILDGVESPTSFSPDGNEFVFIRSDKSARTTSLVIAEKEGKTQRTVLQRTGPLGLVGSPAWSPDGETLVFASMDSDNTTRIYATDLSGSNTRRISNESWDNAYRIAWLPDGHGLVMIATRIHDGYTTRRNQVYYLSYPDGTSRRLTSDGSRYDEWSLGVSNDESIIAIPRNRSSQIWSLSSNGSAASAIQITRGSADGRAGLATMPDGRVGFVSRVGEDLGIWLMNADGSGLKQVSTGVLQVVEELRPDPKGRYLVFSGYKDTLSQLYRYEVEGDKVTQLTFDSDNPVDATVSADGMSITYHSAVTDGLVHPPALFRISIDGGKANRFADAECETPHYSPAGDMLSCVHGDDILVLSATDGSKIKKQRILPYARVNFGVKWTPDGKGLVYIRSENGAGNLWLQPINGGDARPLTDFTFGDVYNFAFSADGTRLFVARGQQISDAILLRNFR